MRTLVKALAGTVVFAAMLAAAEPKNDYFTTSDGVKIHYMTLGDRGSWVVLIHGFTDTAERMFFKSGIAAALVVEDFAKAMHLLAGLRAAVDAFFDEVLVNDPEEVKAFILEQVGSQSGVA